MMERLQLLTWFSIIRTPLRVAMVGSLPRVATVGSPHLVVTVPGKVALLQGVRLCWRSLVV